MRRLDRIARDETGTTAIEYGLICGAIAIAIIVSLTNVATGLGTTFNRIDTVFVSPQ